VIEVVRANPQGLLLIATNPVDALTFAALRLSGLPPARVFGSGTVLDTARLRAELAAHYGFDARNVHAAALTRIIEAVVRDEASVLTVSALIEGQYGIRGVCLSLPAIIDRSGIRRVLAIPLEEAELSRLRSSADAVRAASANAGFDEGQPAPP
jgi:malate/lactate dehydrogenase